MAVQLVGVGSPRHRGGSPEGHDGFVLWVVSVACGEAEVPGLMLPVVPTISYVPGAMVADHRESPSLTGNAILLEIV